MKIIPAEIRFDCEMERLPVMVQCKMTMERLPVIVQCKVILGEGSRKYIGYFVEIAAGQIKLFW